MKEYMAQRREQRRNKLIEMSGGSCQVCGSTDTLEFNHKDRTQKLFGLDKRGMDYSWSKILNEWKKCELLCRQHHQEYTAQQYQNKEIASWRSLKHLPYEHGTMRMYHEQNCRCDDCKFAKKLYRNKQVAYIHEPVSHSLEVTVG